MTVLPLQQNLLFFPMPRVLTVSVKLHDPLGVARRCYLPELQSRGLKDKRVGQIALVTSGIPH